MERASKILLVLEALALAHPSFLGILMVFGASAPAAMGSFTQEHVVDFAVGLIVLAGLVCGWRLILTFLCFGRSSVRKVSRLWWLLGSATAFTSLAVYCLYWLSSFTTIHGPGGFMPIGSSIGLLGYGILFIPTYFHLSAEVWLRRV